MHQRRIHMDDIPQFYSVENEKIMRKYPNDLKIVHGAAVESNYAVEGNDPVEDKDDLEDTSLFVEPFQAAVFTYSEYFLDLKLRSSHQIDFWVVPNQEDVDGILEGKDFDYNSKLSKEKTKEHSATDYVSPGSFIVFANRTANPVTVKLRLESC
ncbi:MAG: hypothetical protein R6U44_11220 [Archaeoglobaceae archaeon]